MAIAYSSIKTLSIPSNRPGSAIHEVTATYANADTTGTITWPSAYKNVPVLLGLYCIQSDAVSSVAINTITKTAMTVTLTEAGAVAGTIVALIQGDINA